MLDGELGDCGYIHFEKGLVGTTGGIPHGIDYSDRNVTSIPKHWLFFAPNGSFACYNSLTMIALCPTFLFAVYIVHKLVCLRWSGPNGTIASNHQSSIKLILGNLSIRILMN